MDCSTPGFPVHHHLLELLKLMSIELVMPSNHPILCRPLLFLPSIFPSIRVFSSEPTPQFESINSSVLSFLYRPTLMSIHDYWKNHSFDIDNHDFVGKVMSLLFNMLSRLVMAFLPRNKSLLISWLQSQSVVILETKKIKSLSLFPLFLHLFAMK